ncbi:MAG: hypothetical protein EBX40_02970 [Gammaproteobacteria bacterium]|nr:hypothetical protein [Gammaproteobacteria bacterium]
MIPSIPATDLHKLRQLISEAPGSYFMLKGPQSIVLRTANYKDNRDKFFTKVKDHLASDLAVEGSYQVCNGSSKTTTPIFLITKGSLAAIQPAVIIQDKQSSDINLVKENAELKAKLHYLELQNRPVPGQGFEGAGDLQGSNHSGSGFRNQHSETETEPG